MTTFPFRATPSESQATPAPAPKPTGLSHELERETRAMIERIDSRLDRIHLLLNNPVRHWWKRSSR
jgi:hypothetical protein